MGLFSAPKAPSPGKMAKAQANASIKTARTNAKLNRVNEYNPYGSRTFTNHGRDRWSSTVSLDPAEQAMLDRRRGIATDFGGMTDPNNLTELPGVNDFSADRDVLTDAMYRRSTRLLDPRFEREGDMTRTRLTNQGIMEGSEAWKNAMDDFGRTREVAYGDAMDRAVQAGSQEQSRMFGLGLTARQQGLDEIDSAMDYLTPNMPGYEGVSDVGVDSPDIAQFMQNSYNAKAGKYNNNMNALFGLGSSFLMGGI